MPKPNKNKKDITVSLSQIIKKQLVEAAEAEEITASEVCRRAIINWLRARKRRLLREKNKKP